MDEKRLDRIENMVEDLIKMVGLNNANATERTQKIDGLHAKMDDILKRIGHLEQSMYRLEVREKRQDKSSARLESIEAQLEIQSERQ